MSSDRIRYRHAHEAGAGAGFGWANEAFSFTPAEYELLRRIRPDLFDTTDQRKRRARWVEFAQSSVGRHFRVR